METIQRLIGTCQICEGEFKLDSSAHMVHHGYKRPGHGFIVGDCMAVGAPAYEQSCEMLKVYTDGLQDALETGCEYLRKLEAGEITELLAASRETRYRHDQKIVTYKPGDEGWADVLDNKIHATRRDNEWLELDIARCERRIASWKLLPIRTIMEAEAEKRAAKDVRDAARAAKKAAKLHTKVESYQKRIDTAVRRHTTSTLAEIFDSAPGKLRGIAGYKELTAAQALALLQRDHVWQAFGLNIQGGRGANRITLSNMRYGMLEEGRRDMKRYPWPEGL